MRQTLEEFIEFNRKSLIDDITRVDLLRYKEWLINRGRTERTAGNKMLRVSQYLRSLQGLRPGEGLVTTKDARFIQGEPEVYTKEELKLFFAHCTDFQRLVFQTYLRSGLRKQELEHLTWSDINFSAGLIQVRAKPGWKPKDWEERNIEVGAGLLDMLRAAPRRGDLVFANTKGRKWTHSWDDRNAGQMLVRSYRPLTRGPGGFPLPAERVRSGSLVSSGK
jgi:integrase